MNDLRMIENELVPVYVTSTGENVVYGTELYKVLEIRRDFSTWIKGRLEECDAVEKQDYGSFPQNGGKPNGGRPKMEYIIKLDIAKEMAMLERNQKGKQVRRYFIRVEEKYKENKSKNTIEQGIAVVKFIADDLNVNTASRILMYENYCNDVGIPTGFLPKYEHNGSREMKAATHLLKENNCEISALKFNSIMIEHGLLEERERASNSGKTKKYKALTDSGLKYGENAVNPHNQKEVQPLYYADVFMELYNMITI